MSYEDIKNFLGNPLVTTVIGLLSAYLGWKYGHRRPRPTVWITAARQLTWSKASALPEPFEIRYRGASIARVTRGTVIFWNDGNDTLNYSAISENDKFRLAIPDGEFLESEILKSSTSNSGLNLISSSDNKEIEVVFEYLDPGEGLTIAFLHTSAQIHPDVKGRIRGCKIKFFDNKSLLTIKRTNFLKIILAVRSKRFAAWGMTFAGFILVLMPFVKPLVPEEYAWFFEPPRNRDSNRGTWLAVIMGFAYFFLGASFLWAERRKYPKSLEYREEGLTSPQSQIVDSAPVIREQVAQNSSP